MLRNVKATLLEYTGLQRALETTKQQYVSLLPLPVWGRCSLPQIRSHEEEKVMPRGGDLTWATDALMLPEEAELTTAPGCGRHWGFTDSGAGGFLSEVFFSALSSFM